DHDRDRRSLLHLLGLRVELLAELHDREAALTERGADRGRRVGRPRRHLQFDVSGDFLCHDLTPVIGHKRPLQGPWCGFRRLAAAVTSHVHSPLRHCRARPGNPSFFVRRWMPSELGLARVLHIKRRKSGKPDLRCQARACTTLAHLYSSRGAATPHNFSPCPISSSTRVGRPKMDTATLSRERPSSTSSTTPLKEANGPSDTRTCSPTSKETDGFGRSMPSCTWCMMRAASASEIGFGLLSAPRNPVTFGVFLMR